MVWVRGATRIEGVSAAAYAAASAWTRLYGAQLAGACKSTPGRPPPERARTRFFVSRFATFREITKSEFIWLSLANESLSISTHSSKRCACPYLCVSVARARGWQIHSLNRRGPFRYRLTFLRIRSSRCFQRRPPLSQPRGTVDVVYWNHAAQWQSYCQNSETACAQKSALGSAAVSSFLAIEPLMLAFEGPVTSNY